MTYEELETEISEYPRFGSDPDLKNLSKYLELMDHPERAFRVVHVAGTNGKGSVCAFCESILRKAGYRTGLFTSPHLIKINERFRIDFCPVSDEELIRAWKSVKGFLEAGRQREYKAVTWFEIMFLMSLLIFKDRKVDYCIMETGLGGRFDATALLSPLISVITSISLDHTAVLGDTIEQIAFEKAGIIKEGRPAIALDENNGAFSVLLSESKRKNVHIEKISCEDITILKKRKNKIDFSINTSYYRDETLSISGCADYQVVNAALAVCALVLILPGLNSQSIRDGLLSMHWDGRMEEVLPGVFLDGAHNPGAIASICASLKEDETQWILLFAVCADKDYKEMVRMLANIPFKRIYITRSADVRGASAAEVESCFSEYIGIKMPEESANSLSGALEEPDSGEAGLICIPDAEQAFMEALRDKKEKEKLLCLGSLYLVGEIKKLLNRLDERLPESEDIP